MTLSLSDGPLSTQPRSTVNFTVDGPVHRLLFSPFPRRVRAVFGGEVVLDTTDGQLLHESNILPALYVPDADIRMDLLTQTELSTHCPFKGDAAYWSLRVGDRAGENVVWGYPTPIETAPFLTGYKAFYWDRMDAWFDEDEEVRGHLRDPYHRVDARRSSRHVMVKRGELTLANTVRPIVVSETGFPNRWYVPIGDVNRQQLTSSAARSHCPYKGDASYWSLRDGSAADVAWSYEEPFADAALAAGHVAFVAGAGIEITVDGQSIDA